MSFICTDGWGEIQVPERLIGGIPQGLKPRFVAWFERAKAEALAYLEARATTTATTKYRGLSAAALRAFGRDDVLLSGVEMTLLFSGLR